MTERFATAYAGRGTAGNHPLPAAAAGMKRSSERHVLTGYHMKKKSDDHVKKKTNEPSPKVIFTESFHLK